MTGKRFFISLLLVGLVTTSAFAQSASYHVERLGIQARAFLETLGPLTPEHADTSESLNERLAQTTDNSHWAKQTVVDDVNKILEAGRKWSPKLQNASPEDLSSARTELESLARRLRVSSAALNLSSESRTSLDFLLLELEESGNVMELQRTQLLAQERSHRRNRMQIGVGLGYGLNGWGTPWGWGSYYPYGNIHGPGPYLSPGFPYRRFGPGWW